MVDTSRRFWFSINWMKSASRWFHYTDILWYNFWMRFKSALLPLTLSKLHYYTSISYVHYYFFSKILPCIHCGTFCTMGTGYFPGVKRPERVPDHPLPSTARLLYLRPLCACIGMSWGDHYLFCGIVVPPYLRVIRSKIYRGYAKPWIIPSAIYVQ
jgi:hypothetical protein